MYVLTYIYTYVYFLPTEYLMNHKVARRVVVKYLIDDKNVK